MNKKLEDMIAESKLKEILHKNEAEKQKNAVVWVLAIIGAIAGIAAIAYAVFRFVTPDYLEDFEDDLMTILTIISMRMIRYKFRMVIAQ